MKPFVPQHLLDGYRTFTTQRLRTEQDRYRELAEAGQSPEVMVVGCCNSRVSPEVIFDARPGELFVVRNVANIVPPYAPDGKAHGVSAALEFAVGALRVKHIVVLGHAQCGGVRAFIGRPSRCRPATSSANGCAVWRRRREGRARDSADGRLSRPARAGPVVNSLDNLMTFPAPRNAIERGRSLCTAPISASPAAICRCLIRRAKSFASLDRESGDSAEVLTATSFRGASASERTRNRDLITPPSASPDELAIDQAFGDLDCVERGAFAQIVGDDPHLQAVVDVGSVRMRLIYVASSPAHS